MHFLFASFCTDHVDASYLLPSTRIIFRIMVRSPPEDLQYSIDNSHTMF